MTIAIHGLMTSRNFGDVLLADIVASWIRGTGRQVVAPFFSPELTVDLKVPKAGGLRQLWKSDHLVFCGGGYFGFTPERPLRKDFSIAAKYALRGTLAKLGGVPYSVIGIGASNLDREPVATYLRSFFRNAIGLAVRDGQSADALRRLGVTRDFATLADMALSLTPDQIPVSSTQYAARFLAEPQARFTQLIGLHISGEPDTPHYGPVFDAIWHLADRFPGAGFVLIEDHAGGPDTGQRRAMRIMADRLSGRTLAWEYSTHWDLVAVLARLDGLVTNKLHTAIVACALDRPAVSVAKHPKNLNFFRQIGQSDRCQMLETFDPAAFIDVAIDAFSTPVVAPIVPRTVKSLADRNRDILLQALDGHRPRPQHDRG